MIKGKTFEVEGKNIIISLKAADCYAIESGECPLNLSYSSDQPELYKTLSRGDKIYCSALFHEIRKNGFNPESLSDEIRIEYCTDTDEFVVNEGRHRVCIATRSDIKIAAIVTEK